MVRYKAESPWIGRRRAAWGWLELSLALAGAKRLPFFLFFLLFFVCYHVSKYSDYEYFVAERLPPPLFFVCYLVSKYSDYEYFFLPTTYLP
jgi:hypothetical protein